MSWSVAKSAIDNDRDSVYSELEAACEANVAANGGTDEVVEQMQAATAAAADLAASVGGSKINVSLSGHANPDHAPTSGYANDQVTVSVSNADAVPTSTE